MVVDVLINGNPSLAHALTKQAVNFRIQEGPVLRIWSIAFGDKAHAWNEYMHTIWADESIVFFIDGYVRINPDAVSILGNAVSSNANVFGGSGVPTTGRNASKQRGIMLKEGGMQGNFCCMKGESIREFKRRQIRLPLGIYRTEVLISTLLAFGIDPQRKKWDAHRILVDPLASWTHDERNWWNYKHVYAQLKRIFRQARGRLENKAVRHHFVEQKLSPEQLPVTSNDLVMKWAAQAPREYRSLIMRSPLVLLAMRFFRRPRDFSASRHPPERLWNSGPW